MTNRTRALVVGSGNIARRHIKNLKRLIPEVDVACISSSGRVLTQGEIEADILPSNLEAAISWGPKLAIVASPASFHLDHAVALLRHDIPVLIEKPLCESLASFARSEEYLVDQKGKIEIGYNLRYLSSAREMKELIGQHVVGKIYSVAVDVGQYLPEWRPSADYRSTVTARKALGGGVLLELSHEFDYLTWLFGRFDSVYCLMSNSGQFEIDVEDRADVMLSREDGLVAHLHMDFIQRKVTRVCKVVGERGNLIWDLVANSIAVHSRHGEEVIFSESAADRNEMYMEALTRFLKVVEGESTPSIGIDDGLYILKLVESMKSSSRNRMPVSIKGL